VGETTGIGWTDHTFNPWMGCQRVSPGCEHCYAETLVTTRMRLPVWGPPTTTKRQRTKAPWIDMPRWDRAAAREGVRRKVFCASLADIFEDHPDVTRWRTDALALLAQCTALDVQLLTKRPENILSMVPPSWLTAWPEHVWIGTTVEDQRRAEQRIPHLLRVPAAVRFLSCEPLLSEVDLRPYLGGMPRHEQEGHAANCDGSCFDQPAVSWVIVGGESGPGARPFNLAWARSILRQCAAAGVPCFVKQLGACASDPVNGLAGASLRVPSEAAPLISKRLRDRAGADPAEWPADLRVQQFPEGAQ